MGRYAGENFMRIGSLLVIDVRRAQNGDNLYDIKTWASMRDKIRMVEWVVYEKRKGQRADKVNEMKR